MSEKPKTLLFSLTKKDFQIQTFRPGGKGGQRANSTDTGVRIIHVASGARGESREHREQAQNKKAAFERMAQTPVFKAWHRMEVARRLGYLSKIEKAVDEAMKPENLKVEDL